MQIFLIALGGSLGALSRFGIADLASRSFQVSFPLGTLIANVLGCFMMGLLLGSGLGQRFPWFRAHVGVGFLGSLTTFSTFSAETLQLVEQNRLSAAGMNVGLNLAVGLAAVSLGVVIGRRCCATSVELS